MRIHFSLRVRLVAISRLIVRFFAYLDRRRCPVCGQVVGIRDDQDIVGHIVGLGRIVHKTGYLNDHLGFDDVPCSGVYSLAEVLQSAANAETYLTPKAA